MTSTQTTPTRIASIKRDDVIQAIGLACPEGARVGVIRRNKIPRLVTTASFTELKVAWFSTDIPNPESLIEVKSHNVNVTTGYLFKLYNLKDKKAAAVYDALFRSVVVVDLDGGEREEEDDTDSG